MAQHAPRIDVSKRVLQSVSGGLAEAYGPTEGRRQHAPGGGTTFPEAGHCDNFERAGVRLGGVEKTQVQCQAAQAKRDFPLAMVQLKASCKAGCEGYGIWHRKHGISSAQVQDPPAQLQRLCLLRECHGVLPAELYVVDDRAGRPPAGGAGCRASCGVCVAPRPRVSSWKWQALLRNFPPSQRQEVLTKGTSQFSGPKADPQNALGHRRIRADSMIRFAGMLRAPCGVF